MSMIEQLNRSIERLERSEERIQRYHASLLHLLEVQVKPSTEYESEWLSAVDEARKCIRDQDLCAL